MARMDAEWIINVLKDLQDFADENGLTASSSALDAAGIIVMQELQKRKAELWARGGAAPRKPRSEQDLRGALLEAELDRAIEAARRGEDFADFNAPVTSERSGPSNGHPLPPKEGTGRSPRFRRTDRPHPTGAIGANGSHPPVRLVVHNGELLA